MFQTKVVEKIKTHILCSLTSPPPPKKKLCAGQATDDNMEPAYCMLNT